MMKNNSEIIGFNTGNNSRINVLNKPSRSKFNTSEINTKNIIRGRLRSEKSSYRSNNFNLISNLHYQPSEGVEELDPDTFESSYKDPKVRRESS